MRKQQFLKKIENLDAQRDHLLIARWVAYHDLAWDTTRSLEFALFRTFAVPKIGNLLYKTRQFTEKTQKRYDDTDLILSEIIENGYDSERAKQAFALMNRMHTEQHIENEELRYVLSTFVMEPYRWNLRYGYRISGQKELEASHAMWTEIGKRMGIKDIPASFAEMKAFNEAYEKANFAYAENARKVADATIALMLGWFVPRFMHGLARPFVLTFMDDALLEAMRYPKPNIVVRGMVKMGMTIRKWIVACIPLPRKPKLRTRRKVKSYPRGYEIKDLGVPPVKS